MVAPKRLASLKLCYDGHVYAKARNWTIYIRDGHFPRTGAFTRTKIRGGTGSAASGINPGGAVVGTFTDPNNIMHGYIRDPNGSFVIIDYPSNLGNVLGTNVNHINSAGAVVGVYSDSSRGIRGYTRN